MEVVFPDWIGTHPTDTPDPRGTLLVPFPRDLPDLAPGQRIVLDSGAFTRSFQPAATRQPVDAWLADLAAWYRRARASYGAARRWCVAPDVFGDPRATWAQWRQWQAVAPDVPVAPVIQLWPDHPLDLMTIHRQAAQYGAQSVVMLSNPARMTAARWGATLTDALALIRRHAGAACHIHLLGAGWFPADVAGYRYVAGLSSLDAISYYTRAQAGERWCACCTPATPWWQAAWHHARMIG